MPVVSKQSFISRIDVGPARTVTIPATHIKYSPSTGYRILPGVGRQASTAVAATRDERA